MNKKFFFHVMCSVCLLACLLVSFVPAEANGGIKESIIQPICRGLITELE